MIFLIGLFLTILAVFLILLVLVQRGRGGGLTGALGGMGGSSAFGAKAGDIFTRITIVVAGVWIASCALVGYWANHRGDRLGGITTSAPVVPGVTPPAPESQSSDAPASTTPTTKSSTQPSSESSPTP
jgi:preprotein translocase subunit SecG